MAEVQERNDRPWFQVQASILDSIDLNKLSAAHERVFWRLHALCCRRGVGDTIPGDVVEIAWALRISERSLQSAYTALEQPGTDGNAMIEVSHKSVRIVKWAEYQPARTGAERKTEHRKKQRAAQVPRGKVAARRASAAILEAEGELEEELEPHTKPSPVREGPKPEAPAAVCVPPPSAPRPIARTDADLLPLFRAYCAGTGQQLTWKQAYFYPTEQLFAHGKPADRIQAVARFYRSKLKDATASYARFAAEIDKWDAECSASVTPVAMKAQAKSAEDWLREGRCPKHPAEKLDAAGNCETCVGLADFIARREQVRA